MSPRVYVRKFDYDEARARRAAGESYAQLAREYGVSVTAVIRACDDEQRERLDAYSKAWIVGGTCPDCGSKATRGAATTHGRCRECANKVRATSVREHELLCFGCKEWKHDHDFPKSSSARKLRRGRHSFCRPCQTRARQEYRERHKVPCIECGAPALPPNEKGPCGASVPRCRPCFHAWQAEYMRRPEYRALRRQRALARGGAA